MMSIIVKNFFKAIIIILSLLFIFSIIINILYYFDIISNNLSKYIKLLVSIITFFIGGVYIGKNSLSKGYINGLKLSLIMVLFFIVMGIIFGNLKPLRIVYYLIITTCITFGAMIGISKKTIQK